MYGFEVVYKRENGSSGSVSGGDGSIQSANDGVKYHIAYYKALGYTITLANVTKFCDGCRGSGQIFKAKRKGGLKIAQECPTCKGKPILESFTALLE